jgi:hypothetical protein
MPKAQVDLTMLKRMMSELEEQLAQALEIVNKNPIPNREITIDYVVEMNKAAGLAGGLMTEAGMIIGDIQRAMSGNPETASSKELMSKLMSGLKGTGFN